MIKGLIRCADCNEVIPNYEGYELTQARSLPGVEWSDADLLSAKNFLRLHSRHKTEELIVDPETCISEKPAYEPLGQTYFLAATGEKRFLIRRTKKALDQPAFYELVPGQLKISNLSLVVQKEALRREMAGSRRFPPRLKEKISRFIHAFQEEVEQIRPEEFEAEAEQIEPGESASQAFGSLKESRWERVLERCEKEFDAAEIQALRGFIEENRSPSDVLGVQIHRRVSVISRVGQGASDLEKTREAEPEEAAEEAAVKKSAKSRR